MAVRSACAAAPHMPLRAVLFDIGDTLWHSSDAPPAAEFRRMAAERAAAFLRAAGIPCAAPELAARRAWDALEAALRRARDTDLVEPDYGELARAALAPLAAGITRAQGSAFLEAVYISGSEGGKAPYADAVAVLRELRRRGFLLATVTNRAFGGERFRNDLRAAGLDVGWDAEAVSVEVGYLKPHPAIFEYACDRLRTRPAACLMVGNSLREDVQGAQRAGMLAAWRRSPPDAEGVVPDYTFDELSELLRLPVLQGAC